MDPGGVPPRAARVAFVRSARVVPAGIAGYYRPPEASPDSRPSDPNHEPIATDGFRMLARALDWEDLDSAYANYATGPSQR